MSRIDRSRPLTDKAPFDDSYGSDLFADFDQSWTFAYAPQANISSATITFGIVDDDSASPGDQVASFQVGAVDLTSALNAVMTAGNSGDYHVYSLTLPGTAFALLAGGSATFHLVLQGPVENPVLIGGGTQTDPNNGAALVFSTLTIQTRGVAPVPEPSTLALLGSGGLGLLGLVRVRRRLRPGHWAG